MQPLAVVALFSRLAAIASASGCSSHSQQPARDLDALAKVMPKSALPPPSGLQLKYVALGVGTQNYTCTSGSEQNAPSANGALARLYDIGTALKDNPLAAQIIGCLSPLAFSLRQHGQHGQYVELARRLQGSQYLLGHHYFHLNTPVFALDQLAQVPYPIARVSKLDETPARAYPASGLAPTDSVDWLFLHNIDGSSQGGVDTVYRVETAGGAKPATCKGQRPSFEVEYVAQYWFYGPAEAVEELC